MRCPTLARRGEKVAAYPDKVRYTSKFCFWRNHSPGKDKEANWLPAPDAEFSAVFRIYGPGPKIVDQNLENATLEKTK